MLTAAPRPEGREDPAPTEESCWEDFARVLGRIAYQNHRARLGADPTPAPLRSAA